MQRPGWAAFGALSAARSKCAAAILAGSPCRTARRRHRRGMPGRPRRHRGACGPPQDRQGVQLTVAVLERAVASARRGRPRGSVHNARRSRKDASAARGGRPAGRPARVRRMRAPAARSARFRTTDGIVVVGQPHGWTHRAPAGRGAVRDRAAGGRRHPAPCGGYMLVRSGRGPAVVRPRVSSSARRRPYAWTRSCRPNRPGVARAAGWRAQLRRRRTGRASRPTPRASPPPPTRGRRRAADRSARQQASRRIAEPAVGPGKPMQVTRGSRRCRRPPTGSRRRARGRARRETTGSAPRGRRRPPAGAGALRQRSTILGSSARPAPARPARRHPGGHGRVPRRAGTAGARAAGASTAIRPGSWSRLVHHDHDARPGQQRAHLLGVVRVVEHDQQVPFGRPRRGQRGQVRVGPPSDRRRPASPATPASTWAGCAASGAVEASQADVRLTVRKAERPGAPTERRAGLAHFPACRIRRTSVRGVAVEEGSSAASS